MNELISFSLLGFNLGVGFTTLMYVLVDRMKTKEQREEAELLRQTLYDKHLGGDFKGR